MAKAKPTTDVLNDNHLNTLNDVIRKSNELNDLLERCERCGIDVDSRKQRNNEARDMANNLKKEFFRRSR